MKKGILFREAPRGSGALVAASEKSGVSLPNLAAQKMAPPRSAYSTFASGTHTVAGAPSPRNVKAQDRPLEKSASLSRRQRLRSEFLSGAYQRGL